MIEKMIKLILIGILVFTIGCVSNQSSQPVKKKSSIKKSNEKTMNLDGAIQSLSSQLKASLKGKSLGNFAVADLVGPGNAGTELGNQISDSLGVILFNKIQYDGYVERKQFKQLVATILSEKGVPYFDQQTVSSYGKSLGLQDMVIGNIRDLGEYYYVIAKIVNVETGRTLAMGQVNLSKTVATQTLATSKQTASLTISVSPAVQGTVTAGGIQKTLQNGTAVFQNMPYGNCPVIVQPYSDYKTIRSSIIIKSPIETLALSISQEKYDVSFTISPPDAVLVIDGNQIPLNKFGFAKIAGMIGGNHSILIQSSKKGYNRYSTQFDPSVKDTYNINLKTSDRIYSLNDRLFQKVQQMKDKQEFNIKLWTNKKSFKIGERITFSFSSEKDCYLNLVDVGPTGNITLLYPNRYQSNQKVYANRIYTIPESGVSRFGFRINPPAGTERVYAIASTSPLRIFDTDFSMGSYKALTRGKTRDIEVEGTQGALNNVKLNAASTCIIEVTD